MIHLTERAASEVKRAIAEDSEPMNYLRLKVCGSGCAGFENKLNLDSEFTANDELFEQHGVNVIIDKRSLLYADGSTIDYINDLNKRGFDIQNPNAKSTCGCSKSFSM